ncbi:MAG: deoxyribonuclease IV [Desulfobacterales bacterium]|nr:deoxyribonuclease IV [Desulfobacterales bacterium]
MKKPSGKPAELLLGAHLSIAGGLHRAIEEAASMDCGALQIFTKNASTWREKTLTEKEIRAFSEMREKTGIRHIAAHTAYLINLASADPVVRQKSRQALKQELIRCGRLEIPWLVLHPGSHMGDGETVGIGRIAEAVNEIFAQLPQNPTRLLLETTAGQGTALGKSFDQLAQIIEKISDKSRIGTCLDTCHVFAAGYDISGSNSYGRTMQDFDRIIGLEKLFLIHVNDAKKPCGSRVDRHAHIGEGMIGISGFSALVNDSRLSAVAKILETPKKRNGQNADPENLALLRELYLSGTAG